MFRTLLQPFLENDRIQKPEFDRIQNDRIQKPRGYFRQMFSFKFLEMGTRETLGLLLYG